MRKKRIAAAAVCAAALSALVWAGAARDQAKPKPMAPGGQWTVHSQERPRPPVIVPPTASTPEQPGQPPSDAIVLFDGTNLSEWEGWAKRAKPPAVVEPGWKIENGYMEVVPGSGDLQSKREFGDSQIHVEWATPAEVKGDGQGRGNSGFFLLGICEIQVLDSYGNDTYPDGQAGGLYGIYPRWSTLRASPANGKRMTLYTMGLNSKAKRWPRPPN